MLTRVFDFNARVVGVQPRLLGTITPADPEIEWLVGVLQEEAQELAEAGNLVEQVDALVDSIIFAMGGLYRLGLTDEQALKCFHAVMDANFGKKAGQKEGREVEGVKDAVKPEGWKGPEARIKEILDV